MSKQLTMFDNKGEALHFFEENNISFLEKCRKAARHICYSNKGFVKYKEPGCVTIDDVREAMGLETQNDSSNKILGAVFRKGFKKIGYYTSKVPGSHGRDVGLWQMKEEA